jgi:type II secretory pathway pseudopilin PulG
VKTRIDSQLKNKKGLTLIQTLIVVAIVVILLGVAFIGIQGLVDRINQTKLDNIAQSMYVSAQNRIKELKASGGIDSLLTATELGEVDVKPADWGEDTAAVNPGNLKYFYHDKDNPGNSTPSDLVDFIFPPGSIDGDVRDDNWVIEFDPVTGYVYSAFYSEKRSSGNYYIDNDETLNGDSSIRFKDPRHSLKGNNKIGYYGGKANMPADVSGNMINASLNVINADILQANMTAILPSDSDISDLEFKLAVKGKTSGNTVTLLQTVTPDPVTKVFSASVILDKLDVDPETNQSQYFKDTFGAITWEPDYAEPRTGALIPGEDLELSFTVSSSDNSVPDVGPIERTTNSLFASLNPENPTEANIAYGRHLQNLNISTSRLPANAITSAKQISDIDFNDVSDDNWSLEKPFLWKSIYGDKTFTPINNSSLMTYSGYIAPPAADSFKIINMHIGNSSEPAGLFGSFAGTNISGVTLVNEKIEGGTDVGGLAGRTTSDLTIKDCRLYIEKEYFASESTYADNILLKGTANVGGFVGSSSTDSTLTIQNSFAATIIEGTGSIGGLIGSKTNGSAIIQNSYADSYLIGGASTSKIGGLAGALTAGSSISGSYSAGFGIMKTGLAEGIIDSAAGFVPNNISSITNSYSLFNCSESQATHIYSTAPDATTVQNVYYFGSEDNKLEDSQKYEFTSNAAAATLLGSPFSDDENEFDTYPYNQNNQKENLELLVIYPYVSIEGLPHYGDWLPPISEEEPEYGKAGLFYWEKVTGGSAQGQGYKIYMVGRKNGEGGEYEAVYHNTTSTAHNTGGIVKEYGYGYYVAKKGGGTETYALDVSWLNVNVSATNPVTTNASADSYFNENYPGYKFYCYTTCDETNLATSYKTNGVDANGRLYKDNYMFMTGNVQNATVTLTAGEDDPLNYTFCPFFAKSIKLTGWNTWNNAGTQPAPQYEPGTGNNKYRIRSLDQLQFINWNSVNRNCDQRISRTNYNYFPYLHATKKGSQIEYSDASGWTYNAEAEPEVWNDFGQSRARQNFIQDYDIECIRRTSYSPIAALGETSGKSYRLPFFAWFGGTFDGQSYKIKNLSITSSCYSVGVFGLTVSSTIKNVVLIRDSNNTPAVIKRPAESPAGYYAIGTLVGMANEYDDDYDNYNGKIENCAVAGYEISDESNQPVSCGEATIGGLAGVLRTNINRCSAVTTIGINTDRNRGTSVGSGYKDNITVGGIAGTNQTKINNCYSGGRVIVNHSLIYPESDQLNIYISGIASSAFTCSAVNMHAEEASAFISPKYYNCYSYMDLPLPEGNVKVAVIGGDACYNENNLLPKQLGGELNNCYYYANNYLTGQLIIASAESGWVDNGINSKSYDDMSLQQFCDDLNSGSPQNSYHKVTANYSFPCGEASLEGEDYPFATVITQEYPGGKKYVHYGEWPKNRRLELTESEMGLDLISYHTDAVTGEDIDDYVDETEVQFFDGDGYTDILVLNFEIRKDNGEWVNFADNPSVSINDKVEISASETEGIISKLTVTGIDKTETPTIILFRYSDSGKYYMATLKVDVTAIVNLSAEPINPEVWHPGERQRLERGDTVNWNLILRDQWNNLINTNEMTVSGNWTFTFEFNPEENAVGFSSDIYRAMATLDPSPFYLEATAQNAGNADFKVQALKIEARDKTNIDSEGNIRTFDSNVLNLRALWCTGKLILKHYNLDGTATENEEYINNHYLYNNGDQGVDPALISTNTDKSFSALNIEMSDKGSLLDSSSSFAGWYVYDGEDLKKLLNTNGTIYTDDGDIAGITEDGKFNINPEQDIELYARWKIPYNLKFVSGASYDDPLPTTTNTEEKYLVVARVVGESDTEYYCMTGESPPGLGPGSDNPVTTTQVYLQHIGGDDYHLASPVSENTMLWDVTNDVPDGVGTEYLKLSNTHNETYIKKPTGGSNTNAVFCGATSGPGLYGAKYYSDMHNLFFQSFWRILFDNSNNKFILNNSNKNIIKNQDGGIWLFKYHTSLQERLHEFK